MSKFDELPHDDRLFVEGLFYDVFLGLTKKDIYCDPVSPEAKKLREAIAIFYESQKS